MSKDFMTHREAKVDETLDLRLSAALSCSHRLSAALSCSQLLSAALIGSQLLSVALGGNGKETTENENP
jgi:hypothetical protein